MMPFMDSHTHFTPGLFSCTNFTTLADEQKQLQVILNVKVLSFTILSEHFYLNLEG